MSNHGCIVNTPRTNFGAGVQDSWLEHPLWKGTKSSALHTRRIRPRAKSNQSSFVELDEWIINLTDVNIKSG